MSRRELTELKDSVEYPSSASFSSSTIIIFHARMIINNNVEDLIINYSQKYLRSTKKSGIGISAGMQELLKVDKLKQQDTNCNSFPTKPQVKYSNTSLTNNNNVYPYANLPMLLNRDDSSHPINNVTTSSIQNTKTLQNPSLCLLHYPHTLLQLKIEQC